MLRLIEHLNRLTPWSAFEEGAVLPKLSILMVPEFFFPYYGGAETWTYNLAKKLVQRGHRVEVFTYKMPDATKDEVIDGIYVHRIGGPLIVSGWQPYFRRFLIHFSSLLWNLIKKKDYDIILGQYLPLIPAWLISKAKKIPIVAVIHNVYGLRFSLQEKGLLKGLARYVFVDLVALKLPYSAVVTVSHSVKKKLINTGISKNKIHIIQGGVNLEEFEAVSKEKSIFPQICFIGRLIKSKNVDDLLHAFKIVQKRISNAKLIIIGDGELRYSLERLVEKLRLSKHVTFTGYLSGKKKIEILKSSHLLVLPSTEEGWGTVLGEAAACRVPSVAYGIPALKEHLSIIKSGVLTPPKDIDALASSITRLLEDQRLREKLGTEGFSNIKKHFNWDSPAQKLEKLLEKLVKER